jgi:hypothetical protein
VHAIQLSDETLDRLKALAEPFVDREPEDVIRRLLDSHEQKTRSLAQSSSPSPVGSVSDQSDAELVERSIQSRVPRERGAEVEIDKHRIEAVSVRDLYEQVLRLLIENHKAQLTPLLPFKTSGVRYLVAKKPVHPSGRPFVVPVEYHDYFMEAHKDYKIAIEHLAKLAKKLALPFRYLG